MVKHLITLKNGKEPLFGKIIKQTKSTITLKGIRRKITVPIWKLAGIVTIKKK